MKGQDRSTTRFGGQEHCRLTALTAASSGPHSAQGDGLLQSGACMFVKAHNFDCNDVRSLGKMIQTLSSLLQKERCYTPLQP